MKQLEDEGMKNCCSRSFQWCIMPQECKQYRRGRVHSIIFDMIDESCTLIRFSLSNENQNPHPLTRAWFAYPPLGSRKSIKYNWPHLYDSGPPTVHSSSPGRATGRCLDPFLHLSFPIPRRTVVRWGTAQGTPIVVAPESPVFLHTPLVLYFLRHMHLWCKSQSCFLLHKYP